MKSRNDRVLEWAVAKAAKDYSADVAILAVYGSYINGTSDELSDVDFFFIPKTKRGHSLARTFIIEGIGFDLFPMSWDRVEGLSAFREPIAPLLGDSRVAFAATSEDGRRFLSLREKMEKNLNDALFMHEKASESFRKGMLYLDRLVSERRIGICRLLSGQMMLCLSDAVAYENQTYFRKGLRNHLEALSVMDSLPKGFLDAYEGIIKAVDESKLKDCCMQMASCCGRLLGLCAETHNGTDYPNTLGKAPSRRDEPIGHDELVSFYEEAISAFNKVRRYCGGACRDYRNAFISGVCLQRVLDEEVPQLGLEVLGCYDSRDLEPFLKAVCQAEKAIVSAIEKDGPLIRYSSVEEFLSSSSA